ncbi:MAG: CbiX/SirB N-terminal domain-containing protein [Melioribacter sp.]|nr:CbiX/SirB N-terminal domain-containing protein [Melioribacter sp.]
MKTQRIIFFVIINLILTTYLLGLPGNKQKISVVIVGHGAPAKDYPKLSEYFKLHDTHSPEAEELENELRNWPRNEQNDPYWAGFTKIIKVFKEKFKNFHSVHYAFNEMCAPTIEEALKSALATNPDVILVTSIMFTPGGGHSEQDIPAAIEMFKEEHPNVKIIYAWPYSEVSLADFINSHLLRFIK